MDVLMQFALLTVSVCLGTAVLVVRASRRSESDARIQVDPVSTSWLADHRTRSRLE